jgi:hypothetical protein
MIWLGIGAAIFYLFGGALVVEGMNLRLEANPGPQIAFGVTIMIAAGIVLGGVAERLLP